VFLVEKGQRIEKEVKYTINDLENEVEKIKEKKGNLDQRELEKIQEFKE